MELARHRALTPYSISIPRIAIEAVEMELARHRALTQLLDLPVLFSHSERRNGVSPPQGIDTKILAIVERVAILVEMELARHRALTHVYHRDFDQALFS